MITDSLKVSDKDVGLDVKEKTPPPDGVGLCMRNWCEESTAHGPGHLIREKYLIGKLFWTLTMLAALTVVVLHLTALITKYYSYDFQEQTLDTHGKMTFPYVTVCNADPFSGKYFDHILYDESSSINKYDKFLTYDYPILRKQHDPDGMVPDSRHDIPVAYFENVGLKEAYGMGHKKNDFILGCLMSYQTCNMSDFKLVQNPHYFNCYTFTGEQSVSAAVRPGPLQGLSLILYLEAYNGDHQDIYNNLSPVEETVGLRVIIHEPGTMPDPIIQGLDVTPGTSTSIALNVQTLTRINDPYSLCTDTASSGDSYKHEQERCFELCLQQRIMNTCNCTSGFNQDFDRNNLTYEYCGYYNENNPETLWSKIRCENSVEWEFWTERGIREECLCHPPCKFTLYEPVISQTKWPNMVTKDDFLWKYIFERDDREDLVAFQNFKQYMYENNSVPEKLVSDNFVRLNIYYRTMMVKQTTQVASYGIESLMSDIGGSLGLWAGFSALTLTEIVYYTVKLLLSRIVKGWSTPSFS